MTDHRTEFEQARTLANAVLETPNRDPDSDLSLLARQFLRMVERVEKAIHPRKIEGKLIVDNAEKAVIIAAQELYDNRLGHSDEVGPWRAPRDFWIDLGVAIKHLKEVQ